MPALLDSFVVVNESSLYLNLRMDLQTVVRQPVRGEPWETLGVVTGLF